MCPEGSARSPACGPRCPALADCAFHLQNLARELVEALLQLCSPDGLSISFQLSSALRTVGEGTSECGHGAFLGLGPPVSANGKVRAGRCCPKQPAHSPQQACLSPSGAGWREGWRRGQLDGRFWSQVPWAVTASSQQRNELPCSRQLSSMTVRKCPSFPRRPGTCHLWSGKGCGCVKNQFTRQKERSLEELWLTGQECGWKLRLGGAGGLSSAEPQREGLGLQLGGTHSSFQRAGGGPGACL